MKPMAPALDKHLGQRDQPLVPARTKKRSPKMIAHIHAIKAALIARGWAEDRYGNLHKSVMSRVGIPQNDSIRHYRYKFGKGSLRRELKHGNMWIRLMSRAYGHIQLTDDGKLAGMRRNP